METAFEGYRMIGRLGLPGDRGAARVMKAVREEDGAAVAIKVFPAMRGEQARREADIGASITHPHVLAPEGIVASAEFVGLVFRWAAGGSLARLIRVRRRLTWPEALTVLIPVADALTAAHERGFVHGDLSAANVLFDPSGRPLLADFGAARAAVETGAEVAVTPTDVAPEVVRGAVPGAGSDLFSLGSVALACLTGRPAWPAESLQDVLIQSTAGQWPDIEDRMAPEPLRVLVRRLLSPEPADRGSAAAVAVDLRRVGRPEPVDLAPGADDPAGSAADGVVPGVACAGGGDEADREALNGRPETRRFALAAATMVRPDALNPPAALTQPRQRAAWRLTADSVRARLSWRGAVACVAVATLIGGAVAGGWWWSGGPQRASAAALEAVASGVSGSGVSASGSRPRGGTSAPVTSEPVTSEPVVEAPGALGSGGDGESSSGRAASATQVDGPAPATRQSGATAEQGSAGGAATDSDDRAPAWISIVEKLDAARDAAFTAVDSELLAAVYTAEAPARAADAEQIARLRAEGTRPDGARHIVRSATAQRSASVAATPGVVTATVRVVEDQPAVTLRDADGTVVGHSPAVEGSVVILHLEATSDGYRIAGITRG